MKPSENTRLAEDANTAKHCVGPVDCGNNSLAAMRHTCREQARPITDPSADQNTEAICLSEMIELLPIDALKPNPRNARTHSKKQIAQIVESIQQFGVYKPIIIDNVETVLAGNGTLAAAILLGLKLVPVVRITHLTPTQKRLLVLADNKIAENAGWDREFLAEELAELSVVLDDLEVDLSLDVTGFETGEVDILLDDFGNEEEPETLHLSPTAQVMSQTGYMWELGKHRLLCGDSRDSVVVSTLFGDRQARLTITDPPYNVRVQGHVGGRGKVKHDEFAFASGEMSSEEYQQFLHSVVSNLAEATVYGGLVYMFIDWRHIEDLLAVGRGQGLVLKNVCVWNKTTPGQGSFYRSAHELIAVFQKPGGKAINNIQLGKFGRNRTNVWSYPGVNTFKTGNGGDLDLHPTVKPVNMIADSIKDASKRGEIVFDPFLGSGTTLLAAEKTGRRCYAIEYEPRYIDMAIRRWMEMTGKDVTLLETGCAIDKKNQPTSEQFPVGHSTDRIAAIVPGMAFDQIAQLKRASLEPVTKLDRKERDHD